MPQSHVILRCKSRSPKYGDGEAESSSLPHHLFQHFTKHFSEISNLLRSYSGECLGSSSDEERSELRYAIWIAEFRELLDLWTHAAFWGNPVCSFTGVFNSFFRRGEFFKLVADLRAQLCFTWLGTLNTSGASLRSMRVSTCLSHLVTAALVIHSCISSFYSPWLLSSCFGLTRKALQFVLRRSYQPHNPV